MFLPGLALSPWDLRAGPVRAGSCVSLSRRQGAGRCAPVGPPSLLLVLLSRNPVRDGRWDATEESLTSKGAAGTHCPLRCVALRNIF